uniref:Serine/threonine-protein kinase 1 n=1 Tax=Erpetoichthys calabaricus TaxID=27687 RepID=A0A8C4S7T6_ERPCA
YVSILSTCMKKAKNAFHQIVKAVIHCHSRKVFHNDIKPYNIMYHEITGHIKLIDFSYGDMLQEEFYTQAPEPFTVWTLGITLFEMICGRMPFKNKMEIVEGKFSVTSDISQGEQQFSEKLFKCRNFIERCLCSHPSDRITVEGILKHPWLCRGSNKVSDKEQHYFHPLK